MRSVRAAAAGDTPKDETSLIARLYQPRRLRYNAAMSASPAASTGDLLGPGDPPPVEIVAGPAQASLLLVCDHAGRQVPRRLGRLGLDETAFERHIAWDIGAAEVARRLAARFSAPLVLSAYSRLVVDTNRRPGDPTAIPEESDGTIVPGNRGLTDRDRAQRFVAIHEPYHAAIGARLASCRGRGVIPVILSIHSFTPMFKGFARPWQIGVLWNRDDRLARPLMQRLAADGVAVGDNQPYSGQDRHGYTMPRHAEETGLPHALIEIRQNLIDTPAGAEAWARKLADVLAPLLGHAGLYRLAGS
jgi:predicted N-formylglutamate amidohydrolase